ncbi:helix-turn-helix transcriptional regulator [Streptomyces sp. SID8499]|uniref:helix-turn-helix domain-containing protein n=1 Tax=Streptomyces sp. SID8499 TaxID=2706106 RepID=UPI0013CA7165|nr:helix-turn-helix transcriptional regulator [Streptomyces sp. SID8499]NED35600.1 helix-turn-helix domain-containing protein [Streptomyces sp. SID8499]
MRLDRDGSPARELAFRLRQVRADAGLTYAQLAAKTDYSISTLQEAASGRRLPTLPVTLAFAGACGADVGEWREYWTDLSHARVTGDSSVPVPRWELRIRSQAAEEVKPPKEVRIRRVWLRWAIVLFFIASSAVAAVFLLIPSERGKPRDFATVVIQNKVAIGPSSLLEDTTPLYMSSRTISHCARRGCELSGTTMWSGAKVVVSCWAHGERLTNEDLTSSGIARNPHGATSDLWFYGKWSDGRGGYVAQVYVAPAFRGTLGLRECGTP